MTAGRGIVHCEMPAGDVLSHGLQLWVNLSSKDKLIEPTYQELRSQDIPVGEKNGVRVRVIAGESMGVKVWDEIFLMFMINTLVGKKYTVSSSYKLQNHVRFDFDLFDFMYT